ncbi:MAG: HAD-IA family hydrolase [Myxococcales bacterium]
MVDQEQTIPPLTPPPITPFPRAVLLDVGFTLTFLNGARIAAVAERSGVRVLAAALEQAERQIRREIAQFVWAATATDQSETKKIAGAAFFRRLLELAEAIASGASLDAAAQAIWAHHQAQNLWCRVGTGVDDALLRMRDAGIKLAVVSNSEGTVEAMLEEVGLRRHMEAVFDSWVVGVAKPDPAVFNLALDHLGVSAREAIMVGDTPAADVVGAQAAGVRVVLIDPYDLHPSAEVPRFRDLPAFVDRLLAQ